MAGFHAGTIESGVSHPKAYSCVDVLVECVMGFFSAKNLSGRKNRVPFTLSDLPKRAPERPTVFSTLVVGYTMDRM